MKVGIFRGGCLTGPAHSGVELHGFLSYLVKVAVTGGTYTIYGYKGKQVRDQIHSYDVIRAFEEFLQDPRPGEVYNIGGGRQNSASVLESIKMIETLTGAPMRWQYEEQNRIGDHICYISDLGKLRSHFPNWSITRNLSDICTELIAAHREVAMMA
jgi:CDP-paratose 2-epimerase